MTNDNDIVTDLGNGMYRLPGGMTVHYPNGMPDQEKALLEGRHRVVMEHIAKLGLSSASEASLEQVLEIRKDPRWKNPLGEDT